MLIKSKADPSIIGLILSEPCLGWNAVKIKTSDAGFHGESGVGSLFNATRQCWEPVSSTDYATAKEAYRKWMKAGKPLQVKDW